MTSTDVPQNPDAAQQTGDPRRTLVAALVLSVVAGAGLFLGWRLFWFMTDDAYISFRYISNSQLGHGYVWNAPPFFPVEGYTSFLWIALLDVVWRVMGIDPPTSANWLALGFSYLTLLLSGAMVFKLDWSPALRPFRFVFVAGVFVFLLLNRTFLAWSSSGLETAMFGFWVIAWAYAMVWWRPEPSRLYFKMACVALLSSAVALTRPEGLLYWATSAAYIPIYAGLSNRRAADQGQGGGSRRHIAWSAVAAAPLVLAPAHMVWRFSFYGDWLPNTYYAKVEEAWVESGWRYLLSFVLEYGLWFAIVPVILALVHRIKHVQGTGERPGLEEPLVALALVFGTVAFQFLYYTFMVGGDHFEYRVYCYALPLMFVVFVWSINQLTPKAWSAIAGVAVFIALSLPVPWTHWSLTQGQATHSEARGTVLLAPHWPGGVRWYAALFDETQGWLVDHFVCVRHQEHKNFALAQLKRYPSREEGSKIPATELPVYAHRSVGVPAWVMPNVAVIDALGLNDYVIARTPPHPDREMRGMAHGRDPPEMYLESFMPNVVVGRGGEVRFRDRPKPATPAYIERLERHWRKQLPSIKEKRLRGE